MQLWCNLKPPWSWGVGEPFLGSDSLWVRESISLLTMRMEVLGWEINRGSGRIQLKMQKHSNLFDIRVDKSQCGSIYRLIFIFTVSSMQYKSALHERNMAPMYWLSWALCKPTFLQVLPYILDPGVLFSTTPARTPAKKASYHACHSRQPRLPPPMSTLSHTPSKLLHEFPSPTPAQKKKILVISSNMWKNPWILPL